MVIEGFTKLLGEQPAEQGDKALLSDVQRDLAAALYSKGAWEEAAEQSRIATELDASLGHDAGVLQGCVTQGKCLLALGKDYEALAKLKLARDAAEDKGHLVYATQISREMMRALARSGQPKAATNLLRRSIAQFNSSQARSIELVMALADMLRDAGDTSAVFTLLRSAFGDYHSKGHVTAAFECCLELARLFLNREDVSNATRWLRIGKSVGRWRVDRSQRAALFLTVGHVAHKSGRRFGRAVKAFARAGRILREDGPVDKLREAYVAYGTACADAGLLETALQALDAAITLPLPTETWVRANLLAEAGSVYSRLGRAVEGRALLEKAVRLYRDSLAWDEAGYALRQLGAVHLRQSDPDGAETFFAESLRVFLKRGNLVEAAVSASNLAALAARNCDHAKALRLARDAIRMTRRGGRSVPAALQLNLGQALLGIGRPYRALMVFRHALATCRDDRETKAKMAKALTGQALALVELGAPEEGLRSYQGAMLYMDDYRDAFELGRHRSGVNDAFLMTYSNAIELCCKVQRADVALEVMQRANGRVLFEGMANAIEPLSRMEASPVSSDCFDRRLAREHNLSSPDPQRLLRHQSKEVLEENKIRELLGEQCLLQYFSTGGTLTCCVTSQRSGSVLRSVPYPSKSELEQQIRSLVANFVSLPKGTIILRVIQEALRRFYDLLLRPVEDLVAESDRLIIVPSGALWNIPFACLFNGEQYLVEQHTLSYLPHAGMLSLPQLTETPKTWVGFGAPALDLPMVQTELPAVAALYRTSRLYMGSEATAANLWEALRQGGVVHIATRVRKDPRNPFAATFEVRDGESTGQVSCGDVIRHPLAAKVAVLRSCWTGATQPWFGGEPASVWASFLLAGCQAVLASPWEVYESPEVSELVVRFYELWTRAGMSPVEALATAQREQLRAGAYPAVWGWPLFIGNIS